MNKKIKIAPSILSADFTQLGNEIRRIDEAGCDEIHVDIMDGNFVPNISFGPSIVSQIRPLTKKPFDVHLMIQKPEEFVATFAKVGADTITVHAESTLHLHRLLTQIKELDKRAGVTLNPATSLSAIKEVLDTVDRVLVMSVNPGFGGQKFIPNALNKIKTLVRLREENNYHYDIEVDGGVHLGNIKEIVEAGADILVAGSAIFGSEDIFKTIQQMQEISK